MKLFDFNDPFFKPLWIRIALVAFPAFWAVFEFVSGAPFWGVIFLALAASAFHGLFIAFSPRDAQGHEKREQDDG